LAPNMPFLLQTWHILLAALCGMVNQRQQQIIEFQNAQIETLLKKLGKKRLLLDDNRRRWLAVKSHSHFIFATDFTTVEVWTRNGLVTFYVLAVMHLKTRRVHIAGITPSPNATWMKQVCRSLTDVEDGFLKDASHLIVDRDTSFIAMRDFLDQNTDTEVVLLPPKSPNLNAYMKRWFRSLKSECFDRLIFCGRKSLVNAVHEYVQHYHGERNHQGLGNSLIAPNGDPEVVAGRIKCRERLGGMLKFYHPGAA
jgi:hypothetical protein